MSELEVKIILSAISFLIGIVAWSLKGWISEKIMKRRASDQLISLGELDLYCRRKHDSEKIYREAEIKHLRELLEKDLNFNKERLEKLENAVSKQAGLLNKINENIIKLI